jgi:hypothetical protein
MKPDWNLMRQIALAVEDTPIGTVQRQPSIDGYSPAEVGHHVHLLIEAGLARGIDVRNMRHTHPQALISGLTMPGHEFAELVRDETRWVGALAEAQGAGAITLNALKRLLATPQTRQHPPDQSATNLDPSKEQFGARRPQEEDLMYIIANKALVFLKDGYYGEQVTVRPGNGPQPVPCWVRESATFKLAAKDRSVMEVEIKTPLPVPSAAIKSGQLIPEAFKEDASARPLGDNPFPADHPAHEAFEEGTWRAKEAINTLRSELLETLSKPSFDFIQAILTYRLAAFSACADCALLVVGNEITGAWYERWLDDSAKSCLSDTLQKGQLKDPNAPPGAPVLFAPELLPRITADLHFQLMRVVAHYKKQASNRVLQAMQSRRDRLSKPEQSPPQEPINTANGDDKVSSEINPNDAVDEAESDHADQNREERAKIRSGWLDQKLAQHSEWTSDTDIATNGGPSYNTIRRYRDGALSTRDLYVRRRLSKAFKCLIEEAPE